VWLEASERGDVAVTVDGGNPVVHRIARWQEANARAGQRIVPLTDELDPTATHHVRVSLLAPEDDPSALRTVRAAAFLVRGTTPP
jgi:hypothetical protein